MIEWRRSRLALWLSAFALLTAADVAGAQTDTYPSRPVRLIVPFAAGGLNDVVARLVAPYLERAFGQPFIIDNRPAASGIVGTDATAKATPDGYTLLMVASSFTVIPATHQKVPYDAQRDLAPIVMVAKNSLLFLVNPKVPAKSLAEFVALAKAEPGKFNYASPGAATQTHLVVELFSQKAGIKMQHVPYRGAAPAITDMLGGQVQVIFDNMPSIIQHVRSGALQQLVEVHGARRETLLVVGFTDQSRHRDGVDRRVRGQRQQQADLARALGLIGRNARDDHRQEYDVVDAKHDFQRRQCQQRDPGFRACQ